MKYNANNERIKRAYFRFLKEAKRKNEASVDAVAKAISRFEEYTGHRDFKKFHIEQAINFKKRLLNQENSTTGKPLSKSTVNSTLAHLRKYFQWLSRETGYKSRISYSDAEYFSLSEKDTRIAKISRPGRYPQLDQITKVLRSMPVNSDIALRNRALIAFTALTGARDAAIASLSLKHVDLDRNCVFQDARDVNTKFSKTFPTYFFPVGDEIRQVVEEWILHLRETLSWDDNDPLFPTTNMIVNEEKQFEAGGLKRQHWKNASPIRNIFKEAFAGAGLPYYNPHSFRKTLVSLGSKVCRTPEEFKAWSQNIGHEKVLTSFYSYGEVAEERQSEIIQKLSQNSCNPNEEVIAAAKVIIDKISHLSGENQS